MRWADGLTKPLQLKPSKYYNKSYFTKQPIFNKSVAFLCFYTSKLINPFQSVLCRCPSVLTIMITAIVVLSCSNEKAEIEHVTINENFPNEVSENVTLFYSDSAKVKVRLKTPLMENYYRGEDSYSEFKQGIDVEFYSDSGTVESTINANYAKYYSERGIMVAEDDVEVVNIDGDILNSEHLVWNRNDEQITSDAFVKITTEDEIIYGNGLVANENFSSYSIQDIKGIISIEEGESEKPTQKPNNEEVQ